MSKNGDHEPLMPFVRESIRPGAVIHSDGSPAYRKLDDIGYGHRRTVHLGSDTPAQESMPAVHPGCVNLKASQMFKLKFKSWTPMNRLKPPSVLASQPCWLI